MKKLPDTWESRLGIRVDELATLCQNLGVSRLSLFGSVLTDRLGPQSDVDLLVEFRPGAVKTLLDRGWVQMEFEEFFGRKVDLAELSLIEHPIRRREIQATAVEIFKD